MSNFTCEARHFVSAVPKEERALREIRLFSIDLDIDQVTWLRRRTRPPVFTACRLPRRGSRIQAMQIHRTLSMDADFL